MLFATFVSFVVYCAICTLKYRPVKPVELPIEVSSPDPNDDPWSDALDLMETSSDEEDDNEDDESYVDARIRENETWTPDDLEFTSELLPVDEVKPEPVSETHVRCYTLLEWSDEDLYQVAKDNGLKPTKRWKRETFITKLNAILAA